MQNPLPTVICLMGPTAAGKTQLALEWAQRFRCALISVDSAMVYRGMDIGTAKPTAAEQAIAPHALIDFLDPSQPYSAGDFCVDAHREIELALAQEKTPVLVGGTMLYFRALQQGLAPLPKADAKVRHSLCREAENLGWEALHQRLTALDPTAAARISPQDAQRIQRALEVYMLTGMTLTTFLATAKPTPMPYRFVSLGLIPEDREKLHQQIAHRFQQMLAHGFLEEVQKLQARGDLHLDLPAMRAVGYKQVWEYLEGKYGHADMIEKGIIATRQLAKRQLTWLRSWSNLTIVSTKKNTEILKSHFHFS